MRFPSILKQAIIALAMTEESKSGEAALGYYSAVLTVFGPRPIPESRRKETDIAQVVLEHDGRAYLEWNPEQLKKYRKEEWAFIMAHESGHLLLEHLRAPKDGIGDNTEAWVLATEASVNDRLINSRLGDWRPQDEIITTAVINQRFKMNIPPGLTDEEIYEAIRAQSRKETQQQIKDFLEKGGICSGVHGGGQEAAGSEAAKEMAGQAQDRMLAAAAEAAAAMSVDVTEAHQTWGCISGDAVMVINRPANPSLRGLKIKLKDLVRKITEGSYDSWVKPTRNEKGQYPAAVWDLNQPTLIQRELNGIVRHAEIANAWNSGLKVTYTVTTSSGRSIRATDEHPFLTERGWRCLGELQPGDLVHVRGDFYSSEGHKKPKPRYGFTTAKHHPYPDGKGRVLQHRMVAEAALNGLDYDTFKRRLWKDGDPTGLKFIDPAVFAVHHIDGNPRNNELTNLKVLTHKEHHSLHAIERNSIINTRLRTMLEEVVSITRCGEEETYDIEVKDSPHNFIADGFVVHNSMALGMPRGFEEQPAYQVPWEHLLAQAVASKVRDERMVGYNRKWAHIDPDRPPMMAFKEVPDPSVVCYVDLSGSIDMATASKFRETMRRFPKAKFKSFDHAVYPVFDLDNLQGGGGTSFDILVDDARESFSQYPDVIVVLTDGYASKPDPDHRDRWIWCVTESGSDEAIQGCGRIIHITSPQ